MSEVTNRTVDRLKRDSPAPALLRNIVFARWDSVTGPTVVRAWPELLPSPSPISPFPDPDNTATPSPASDAFLTSEIARFIARNCLTAEVTNSTCFGNRVNSRIFTVPEVGMVAYAIVFACTPMTKQQQQLQKTSRSVTPISSRHPSTSSTVVLLPPGGVGIEELYVWFYLFDAAITRVIEMRTILEESLLMRYVHLLRVALTRNSFDDKNQMTKDSSTPASLIELLDSHAVHYEKIFTTFAGCLLLPTIRFSSTAFAVSQVIVNEDTSSPASSSIAAKDAENINSDDLGNKETPKEGSNSARSGISARLGWWRGGSGATNSNSELVTNEEARFVRRSIAAFLASGGRALVLGQSSKSVNGLVHTLAMFLPLHCRRLCRLAAARPNESFLAGFYVQGLVGAPYPTGTELLMSPHALAVCNTHDRTVCRTPPPQRHRLCAAAFNAARIRNAWEGVTYQEGDDESSTSSFGTLSLSEESIPDESIIGDFLLKLALCSPFDNGMRQRFVESTVADFYTRAFCLVQLVQRSIEQATKQPSTNGTVLTRREIAKMLDLRKPEGDLAVLAGVGELLQPGFGELFDRCPL